MFSVNEDLAVITDTYKIFDAGEPTANSLGQVDIASIALNLNL